MTSPTSQWLPRLCTPQESDRQSARTQTHRQSQICAPAQCFLPSLALHWAGQPQEVEYATESHPFPPFICSHTDFYHLYSFPCLFCLQYLHITSVIKKFKGALNQASQQLRTRSKLPNRNQELNNLTLTEFVSEEWDNSEADPQSNRLSKHCVWFLSCWLYVSVWINLPDKSHLYTTAIKQGHNDIWSSQSSWLLL